MKKRYLHVGCGDNILPKPFENLDIREFDGVDHISKAEDLSLFEDDTFDLVYASHILEHYPRNQIENVLSEWVRVCKPDGIVRISVPNFENCVKIYQETNKIEDIIGPVSGGQTYDFEFHYCSFDKRSLSELMLKCGLTAIHPWIYQRTTHSDHWDFSQAVTRDIQVSLNLEGRKRYKEALPGKNLFETKKDKLKQGKENV